MHKFECELALPGGSFLKLCSRDALAKVYSEDEVDEMQVSLFAEKIVSVSKSQEALAQLCALVDKFEEGKVPERIAQDFAQTSISQLAHIYVVVNDRKFRPQEVRDACAKMKDVSLQICNAMMVFPAGRRIVAFAEARAEERMSNIKTEIQMQEPLAKISAFTGGSAEVGAVLTSLDTLSQILKEKPEDLILTIVEPLKKFIEMVKTNWCAKFDEFVHGVTAQTTKNKLLEKFAATLGGDPWCVQAVTFVMTHELTIQLLKCANVEVSSFDFVFSIMELLRREFTSVQADITLDFALSCTCTLRKIQQDEITTAHFGYATGRSLSSFVKKVFVENKSQLLRNMNKVTAESIQNTLTPFLKLMDDIGFKNFTAKEMDLSGKEADIGLLRAASAIVVSDEAGKAVADATTLCNKMGAMTLKFELSFLLGATQYLIALTKIGVLICDETFDIVHESSTKLIR